MILEILLRLADELNLPSWTARTLKAAYDEAASIPEDREIQYSIAWHVYHEMLDNDSELSLLSMAYALKVRMPLCQQIDATGAFVF
jgi:hypothetical protein